MRTGITVDVTANDRQRLAAIVADRNSPQKHVWRANIVLLTADGCRRQAGAPSVRFYPLVSVANVKRDCRKVGGYAAIATVG
jgi:hypothetical protein